MSLSRTLANTIVKKKIKINDVILMLRKYKLLSVLPSVLENIKKMKVSETERDIIVIESPFPVNKDALNSIKNIIGDDKAEHTVKINENLLAGFKARWKGKLYDGSAERVIKLLLTNHQN